MIGSLAQSLEGGSGGSLLMDILRGSPTPTGARRRPLRPLRHRDFRLLWVGLAVPLIGSGLCLVVLGGRHLM